MLLAKYQKTRALPWSACSFISLPAWFCLPYLTLLGTICFFSASWKGAVPSCSPYLSLQWLAGHGWYVLEPKVGSAINGSSWGQQTDNHRRSPLHTANTLWQGLKIDKIGNEQAGPKGTCPSLPHPMQNNIQPQVGNAGPCQSLTWITRPHDANWNQSAHPCSSRKDYS